MSDAATTTLPQHGEVWRNKSGRIRNVVGSGRGYVQYERPPPAPADEVLTVSALAWMDWVETTGGRRVS